MARRILAVVFLVLLAGRELRGQSRPAVWAVPAAADTAGNASPGVGAARAFLFSAAVPGAGQRELGLDRWVPYLVFEVWSWFRYFDRRSEGRALEARYRDLAWEVARRISVGPRRDGDFEYYEALGKYARSGAYDADPERAGVQPEQTPGTYNGSVWALAQAIYLPAGTETVPDTAPEYVRALDYYREHAVGAGFAWAWGESSLAQEAYRDLMHASDEALRSSTRTLGLILANHLISAVDALVSARLGGPRSDPPRFRIETAMSDRGGEPSLTARVRITWPRR